MFRVGEVGDLACQNGGRESKGSISRGCSVGDESEQIFKNGLFILLWRTAGAVRAGHQDGPRAVSPPNTERDTKVPLAWSSFAAPVAPDDTAYGYRWAKDSVTKTDTEAGSIGRKTLAKRNGLV